MSGEWSELPPLGAVYFDPLSRREVEFIFKEIFIDEDYLRSGITLSAGDVVFDVGANIGLFSIYVDRLTGGDCTLFAFEPVPATSYCLQKNFLEHGLLLRKDVHMLPFGLGRIGAPRSTKITVFPGLPGNSTMFPREKAVELEAYKDATLAAFARESPIVAKVLGDSMRAEMDALFASYEVECAVSTIAEIRSAFRVERIDLLKIDCEGAELDVIEGIDDETWPIIRQIVLETAGEERARLLETRLAGAGFSVVVEQPRWAVEHGLTNFNLYAVR